MTLADRYEESITLPRAVRFPVELFPPAGFDADRPETWPKIPGRLEYVNGKLLFMPLCGDVQQDVVTDTVITLGAWIRAHREFVLGTNEAGMRLLGSTRAADAAIWRRSDLGNYRGGLRRVPPVLTIEVAGADEAEDLLREKALWYLNAGIEAVWVVLPEPRAVLVITASGEARFHLGDQLPPIPSLPGLTPQVGDFFTQLSA